MDLDNDAIMDSTTSPAHRLNHLILSEAPNDTWSQLFDEQRRSHYESNFRRAWVDGAYLVVDCPPDELDQNRIDSLRQDVVTTNAKYREILAEQARRDKAAGVAEQQEQENLKKIKDRLKF